MFAFVLISFKTLVSLLETTALDIKNFISLKVAFNFSLRLLGTSVSIIVNTLLL